MVAEDFINLEVPGISEEKGEGGTEDVVISAVEEMFVTVLVMPD